MAVSTESITFHAARQPLGDLELVDPDASELDDLTPPPAASTAEASDILMLHHTPLAPAVRESAYDEGVGGYDR
jgi:hypothetical protein